MELINKVKREWEYHANGYNKIIKDELKSFRSEAWIKFVCISSANYLLKS